MAPTEAVSGRQVLIKLKWKGCWGEDLGRKAKPRGAWGVRVDSI